MSASQEEIRSALFATSARDRATWLRMGMSLKSELGESGVDLWLEWSRTDESYVERDARAVWKSIKPGGGITIRTLFGEAIRNGWTPETCKAGVNRPPATDLGNRTSTSDLRKAKLTSDLPLDWSPRAEGIWRITRSLRGTLGETYLHHRGCVLPPRDSHLRFLPGTDRYPPSLVAAVTDIITAKPISLHFTRLSADGHGKAGTERDKLLLAGHRKRGGCIRLWPDECVTYGLGLAEGIETALAAAHAFTPTWAAIDAGNMAAFPVLACIEALTVFADHDDAGLQASATIGQRWADAGRDVLIVTPDELGADIADVVAA